MLLFKRGAREQLSPLLEGQVKTVTCHLVHPWCPLCQAGSIHDLKNQNSRIKSEQDTEFKDQIFGRLAPILFHVKSAQRDILPLRRRKTIQRRCEGETNEKETEFRFLLVRFSFAASSDGFMLPQR